MLLQNIIIKLRYDFVAKIRQEWSSKWEGKFGKLSSSEAFPTSNEFLIALSNDISKTLSKKDLSQIEIEKILPSPDTIKRQLKSDYKEGMRENTRECLALYVGFSSWEHYVSLCPKEQATIRPLAQTSNNNTKFFFLAGGFVILLFIVIFLFINRKSTPIDVSKIQGKVIEASNNSIAPSKILFAYDLSKLDYDSAFINFGNGKILLDKPQDTLKQVILYPELINVCLRLNQTPSFFNILIKSNGWFAKIKSKTQTQHLLNLSQFQRNSVLHLPTQVIEKNLFDYNDYYVSFLNIQDFDFDADNMIFETRVKNPQSEGGIYCSDVSIDLIGTDSTKLNALTFNLLHPSCIDFIHIKVAETDIGFNANTPPKPLDMLGVNTSNWVVIKSITKNNFLTIFADNKELYDLKYEGKIGKLKLIEILFKGSGTTDYVKISDSKTGKLLFFDDFDKQIMLLSHRK